MQLGDKVRFLRDVGGGVVTEICDDGSVVVKDDSGFEIPCLVQDLVVVTQHGDELLSTRKIRRGLEASPTPRTKKTKKTLETKSPNHKITKSSSTVVEVDLHSEKLGLSAVMSPHDQKKRQLEEFRRTMNRYRNRRGTKLIFIHGKGEGILREAIRNELSHKYKSCTFCDASFATYGMGGATEVVVG